MNSDEEPLNYPPPRLGFDRDLRQVVPMWFLIVCNPQVFARRSRAPPSRRPPPQELLPRRRPGRLPPPRHRRGHLRAPLGEHRAPRPPLVVVGCVLDAMWFLSPPE